MERDAVRGCGAGRERDDGPQGAAPQQIGADTAAGAARRGGGRHQQDRGAALVQMGQRMLHPGELGLRAGGEAVLPARVVGELVVSPVALVERRMAEHGVDGEAGKGVGAQGVTGPHGERAPRGIGVQGEPERGECREVRVVLLRVQRVRPRDGAQQGPGPRRRVEDGARGPAAGARQCGHQLREAGRGERVLPRVGVELAPEQELEGLPDPGLRGEFGGGAQQWHGGQQFRTAGGAYGPSGFRCGAEAVVEHRAEGERQHTGHRLVRDCGELSPSGRAAPHEQQGAARVDQRGHGTLRMARQLLPDPFTEGDLGDLPLLAQPRLHRGQGERRARLGAADRLGEVGVPATPVADGSASHAREPGDPGSGHLCRVLRHWLSPWSVALCGRAYRADLSADRSQRVPTSPSY